MVFEENEILLGWDPAEGIVSVELLDGRTVRLFLRREGGIFTRDEPFVPFMLLEEEDLMEGFKGAFSCEALSGPNPLKTLILFPSWEDCQRARSYLQKKTGEPASSPKAPYLFLSDPVHQFLLSTGKTLFKGLSFDDLHQMALDIETACAPGYEFSNPQRDEDRIISIALMDNRGYEEVLFGKEMGEREMLLALGERISERDPDLLLGHNLFNFDLDYITARAKMHKVALRWGRDGSTPQIRRSRFAVAERVIDYNRMEVRGRHVLDTLFLLQYYDVSARELESYGLKSAARHFGISEEDRTYIPGGEIQRTYEMDPETLKKYNLEDVKETLGLSELLGYPFFLETRIFPFSYQNIFVRGNATKINALFLREYLRRRASVPKPKEAAEFEGGYTDVFVTGVVHHVIHCDVASLYPSVMLAYGLKPSGDTLGIFLPLLKDLREFRLAAKARAGEARSSHDRNYFEALQQTFKVLINSFYGYLGTSLHHFSDPPAAAEVARLGREVIHRMLDGLRAQGAVPVEIDTDGIYFVPPEGSESEEAALALVERLSRILPQGIEVNMDGRYRAMFSYKRKNYALLNEKGEVLLKGSALRSRGMEKYLREFLSGMIRLLLEGRGGEVQELLRDYCDKLERHEFDISWLEKTETMRESLETYREKVRSGKRNISALYELAAASGREYKAGDQISHYVTGDKKRVRVYEHAKLAAGHDPSHPDENVAYYREKLLSLYRKFDSFIPADKREGKLSFPS